MSSTAMEQVTASLAAVYASAEAAVMGLGGAAEVRGPRDRRGLHRGVPGHGVVLEDGERSADCGGQEQ